MKKIKLLLIAGALLLSNLVSAQTCKDNNGVHSQFLYPELSGKLFVDVVDPADGTASRQLMISDTLNNPIQILPYFQNSVAVKLTPGDYNLSARKTCPDGTFSNWGYTYRVHVPNIIAPSTSNISIAPGMDNLIVFDSGYQTGNKIAAKWKMRSETVYRFLPRYTTSVFTIPNLPAGTLIDVQLAYEYPDYSSSGFLTISGTTTSVGLTNMTFINNGNGLTFNAPLQNTNCEVDVNHKYLRSVVVVAGFNGIPLTYPATGAPATIPGDTISVVYFKNIFSIVRPK